MGYTFINKLNLGKIGKCSYSSEVDFYKIEGKRRSEKTYSLGLSLMP
jgi:hypothetical protein